MIVNTKKVIEEISLFLREKDFNLKLRFDTDREINKYSKIKEYTKNIIILNVNGILAFDY
ncbi:hypothetical protein DQM28_11455 [Leptospira mayottensis]|uniref:Uncharacterized protein n=1 Tax=Leptospira mayottensis TaxID=1137606 RepID=A0ABM6Y9U5_9LEPT|nr:hypothetical protein DQM28_11455 [Leptospira mayottensis]